jgi:hypothetical protein
MVPHGYLSDDEGLLDEFETSTHYFKSKGKNLQNNAQRKYSRF